MRPSARFGFWGVSAVLVPMATSPIAGPTEPRPEPLSGNNPPKL
jgi:hypothetical protein